MWIGTVLMTLGTGLFVSMDAHTSTARAIGFELIEGVGAGLLFEPPLLAIQQGVHQDDVGTATSTQAFTRSLAISLGVIVGGIVFQQSMDLRRTALTQAGLSNAILDDLSGKNAGANVNIAQSLPPTQELAVKQAFAWSIRNMFIMFTCISALSIVASFFVVKTKLSKEHTETVTGLKKAEAEP
jgi:hypothetical protein